MFGFCYWLLIKFYLTLHSLKLTFWVGLVSERQRCSTVAVWDFVRFSSLVFVCFWGLFTTSHRILFARTRKRHRCSHSTTCDTKQNELAYKNEGFWFAIDNEEGNNMHVRNVQIPFKDKRVWIENSVLGVPFHTTNPSEPTVFWRCNCTNFVSYDDKLIKSRNCGRFLQKPTITNDIPSCCNWQAPR